MKAGGSVGSSSAYAAEGRRMARGAASRGWDWTMGGNNVHNGNRGNGREEEEVMGRVQPERRRGEGWRSNSQNKTNRWTHKE